ncbi:COMPASS (complex proteins associated with Set1p) component [Perkinsus chesapeaki]|uniref:COMPASS (Complex proteins associated with Set1p) component n=1 Tax=Perkinsus chesapeaki TaxID=330153 RepID=A0A7J6N3C7_PERCH|nr:COMPASS (complex proteins associated with Set1p) component [Perkinsus chesapeaki]
MSTTETHEDPETPTVPAEDEQEKVEEKEDQVTSPVNEEKSDAPEEGKSEAYPNGKVAAEIERAAEEPSPMPKPQQLPLRQWLEETVAPVLVPALDAVARERPEDPVTFVAEYLLKHNPKGNEVQEGDEEVENDVVEEKEEPNSETEEAAGSEVQEKK